MSIPDLRAHYADYYGNDPRLHQWRTLSARDKAKNVIDLWHRISSAAPKHVVDLGCGDGALLDELANRDFGETLTGYEISASAVEAARKRVYARPVELILLENRSLADDSTFDLAILSHVIEHVDSPRELLREAARVANYVFVEVPLELNSRTPYNFTWTNTGHINLFDPLTLRHLVQSVGMDVIAERVSCPRRDVFIFREPRWRGTLHWAVKAGLLALSKKTAARTFTYHGSLLARAHSFKDITA